MTANYTDESFDAIARVLPPRRLRVTANNATWTNLFAGIEAPAGTRRFYLSLGACAEGIELRLHPDDAEGITIPAGQVFHYPFALSLDADPAAKLTSGTSAVVTGLVAFPDTA